LNEQPVRILLIDENQINTKGMRERIARNQRVFEVITISTQGELIRCLTDEDIDLILTDTSVFGLNNQQIVDLIQENSRQPVVIFTASGAEGITLEAMKRGAVDFVVRTSSTRESTANLGKIDGQDLSERETQSKIQTKNEMHLVSKAFENTDEGIFITDDKADIISINEAFTAITGFGPDEVLGEKTHLFQSEHRDQDFFDQMWDSLNVTGRWQGEIWNRNKDGEIYPEWLTISTVKDEQEKVANYIGIFTDITARKKSEERLRYLATHDPLTDLPNRDLFKDRLSHTLARARRKRNEAAVLQLDLDNFKSINDSYGHSVGDRLLRIVADRLSGCLRKSDTVARMGGDEFTFILEEIPNNSVCSNVAEKILNALAEPILFDGHKLCITASIGISIFPDDGHDPDTLLRHADIAMYQSKNKRNSYSFYKSAKNHDEAA
jgi:diguanylate cyclase (GGDEF)-like protein/PAS domain S-box-containing protein